MCGAAEGMGPGHHPNGHPMAQTTDTNHAHREALKLFPSYSSTPHPTAPSARTTPAAATPPALCAAAW